MVRLEPCEQFVSDLSPIISNGKSTDWDDDIKTALGDYQIGILLDSTERLHELRGVELLPHECLDDGVLKSELRTVCFGRHYLNCAVLPLFNPVERCILPRIHIIETETLEFNPFLHIRVGEWRSNSAR